MKIQLLHFAGCPNVEAARAATLEALRLEHVDAAIEEIDVHADDAPAWARGWGSPTILVDGADVTGAQPSDASACRLYQGGAPSVDVIRARIASVRGDAPRTRRVALPMIGAVTAAIAASACCLVPAALAIVGVSGAGFAARFAPYRTYFLVATALALTAGFWFAYRPQRDACGCAAPSSRRGARIGLWITMVLTIGLAMYPLLGNRSATAGSTEAAAKAQVTLKITGMDCKECTSTIAKRIKKVPGVVSTTIDFESGLAFVRYDGRDGVPVAAIDAVRDAGFDATLQK